MLVASSLLAACSGSSEAPPTTAGTTSATLPSVRPGQGVVVLSGDSQRFTVNSCVDGPAVGDTPEATQQFRMGGSGNDGTVDFAVTATRYSSTTGAGTTLTETVSVTSGRGEAELGIEARRTSLNGRWLDLKQPGAATPLLARRGKLVTVTGRFGPAGSRAGDKGIVAGQLVARCPS